jgi:DNA-binding MarR family transcriptional regulator
MDGGSTPVEEVAAPRLLYLIGRFHTVLRAELGRRLAPTGLTIAEYTALSVLGAGSGLSGAQLARRSLVTPQAMNQVLASLEEKGLVSRPPDPGLRPRGHHRARAATLTPAGRRSVGRAQRLIDELEDTAFSTLDRSERAALAGVLREGASRMLGAEDISSTLT